MEYYFNGGRILCEYIGDYFILLAFQYMSLCDYIERVLI